MVSELPYMIGPEKVIEKIKDGVQKGRIKGISAVTNLTDREHDMRLVIEVKSGFNPEAVRASLFKHTPMEDSFGSGRWTTAHPGAKRNATGVLKSPYGNRDASLPIPAT